MKLVLHLNILFTKCILCLLLIAFSCTFSSSAAALDSVATQKGKSKKTIYGLASFYANKFNGRRTANGETFSQSKFTCACNVLPLGTLIKVTNLRNGKTVIVKVNDRLHKKTKRLIDLTKIAAHKLGFVSKGLTKVKIEVQGKKSNK